jgi:hypothetical protein
MNRRCGFLIRLVRLRGRFFIRRVYEYEEQLRAPFHAKRTPRVFAFYTRKVTGHSETRVKQSQPFSDKINDINEFNAWSTTLFLVFSYVHTASVRDRNIGARGPYLEENSRIAFSVGEPLYEVPVTPNDIHVAISTQNGVQ